MPGALSALDAAVQQVQRCTMSLPATLSCLVFLCLHVTLQSGSNPWWHMGAAVLIDVDTLNTLPDRELASGISEIIKYGLIRDPDLFVWLEANMERLLQRDPEARWFRVLLGLLRLIQEQVYPRSVSFSCCSWCVQQCADVPVAAVGLHSFDICAALALARPHYAMEASCSRPRCEHAGAHVCD